jgi:hypothetical protein
MTTMVFVIEKHSNDVYKINCEKYVSIRWKRKCSLNAKRCLYFITIIKFNDVPYQKHGYVES